MNLLYRGVHCATSLADDLCFYLIPFLFGLTQNERSHCQVNEFNFCEGYFWHFNLGVWQIGIFNRHCGLVVGWGIPIDWMTTCDHCVFKGNGVWGKCGNWDILMATKILHSKQWLLCVWPLSKHEHFLHIPTEVSAVLITVITFGTNQKKTFNLQRLLHSLTFML